MRGSVEQRRAAVGIVLRIGVEAAGKAVWSRIQRNAPSYVADSFRHEKLSIFRAAGTSLLPRA